MQVTSNFDMQKKDYNEVAPHNHRVKTKTKNKNINWQLTKYDILRQHPTDFDQLMIKHWGTYALKHDIKRIRSGHPNDTYGDYSSQERNQILHQVLKSAKGKNFSQKIKNARLPYLAQEMLNSVKGMFQRKNKLGYRTIETGFARGTNHQNQIGADRKQIWRDIKRAYPQLNVGNILRSEAHGLNRVPDKMNQMLPGFQITDYDVHVDENKYYFGQAHLQGRMALLGRTKKGKPSFNLNNAIKASVTPHKKLLRQLDKKYYSQQYGTKHDHMNLRNNVGRFHAFNMLISYITFTTVARQLEHDFPKANLNFHLIRTYSSSVNHDEYIRQQDQKQRTASAINRDTSKARHHLQRSYASSQAQLSKKKANFVKTSSKDSQAVSQAWVHIHQQESLIDQRNINLLARFMTVTQAHNPNASNSNHTLKDFAKECYFRGFNYGNQIHRGEGLIEDQQSEASSLINQRFNNVAQDESANASIVSSANQVANSEAIASSSISDAASQVAKDSENFSEAFASYHSFQNHNINQLSSLLGSSEVSQYGVKITADALYQNGMNVDDDRQLSQADLVSYLIKQRQKKRKKALDAQQRALNQKRKVIRQTNRAQKTMMYQQFNLLVPKSFHLKGISRQQTINKMANGTGIKWSKFGDKKYHSNFDLEVHFVGYDLQHDLESKVRAAQNEIDDYEKNEKGPQK